MAGHILLAEDDKALSALMQDFFRAAGVTVTPAYDGEQALVLAQAQPFDLLVLDVMMPHLNGLEVCEAVRQESDVPVIFVTALGQEGDTLAGFRAGADDYITKPFSLSVLYAKTMALIKRNERSVLAGDRIEAGGITLVRSTRKVFAGKQEIALTPKEYALLLCLMQNKNRVLSREQLLVKCWGYDYEGESRAVDTHIKRLREKLGDCAGCIQTVIKAGYRLEG